MSNAKCHSLCKKFIQPRKFGAFSLTILIQDGVVLLDSRSPFFYRLICPILW